MHMKPPLIALLIVIAAVPLGWIVTGQLASGDVPTGESLDVPPQETAPEPTTTQEDAAIDAIVDEAVPDFDVDLGDLLDEGEPSAAPSTPATPTQSPDPVPQTSDPSGITATELAQHNVRADCWVAYKGLVYDVTSFLPSHPGGVSAISRYCGTADAFAAAFNKQHRTKQDARLAREADVMGDYLA